MDTKTATEISMEMAKEKATESDRDSKAAENEAPEKWVLEDLGADRKPFSGKWVLHDAANVDEWVCEPLVWIVEDIIAARTISFLGGLPKDGKSLLALGLALDLACAVAGERKWLGKFATSPAKILYLSAEDPDRRIKERIMEMKSAPNFGKIPMNQLLFLIEQPLDLMELNERKQLYEIIKENKIDFLIIDVLGRVIPELDEYTAKDIGKFTNVLLEMRKTFGLPILVLDHTRKGSRSRESREPNPLDLLGSAKKIWRRG